MKRYRNRVIGIMLAAVLGISSLTTSETDAYARTLDSENITNSETVEDSELIENVEIDEESELIENIDTAEESELTDALGISENEEISEDNNDSEIFDEYTESDEIPYYGLKASDYEAPVSESVDEVELQEVLPSSYDSRDAGNIPPVRNQGTMGNCWAHAALASVEASAMTKGIDSNPNYSERHMSWFAYNRKNVNDPLGNTGDDATYLYGSPTPAKVYNEGGNYLISTIMLSKWEGAADESDYPYVAQSINVNTENLYKSVAHVQNIRYIKMSQMNSIKKAVMENGAVLTDYLHLDKYYNSATASYYDPELSPQVDHSVNIIGWDDNYPRTNFKSGARPGTDGAWLVRNSWGASWGKSGYFWVSYEDAVMDKMTAVSYEAEANDNYDKNYFHDGSNFEERIIMYNPHIANVFTAADDEEIKAVSIMLGSADADYTVEIYTDIADLEQGPASGTKVLSQSGKTTFAGLYTIPLEKTVEVAKGTQFAVAFKFDDSQIVFIDSSDDGNYYPGRRYVSSAEKGQSYHCDNENWEPYWTCRTEYTDDGGYIGQKQVYEFNYRIHAFTDVKKEGITKPTSIVLDKSIVNGTLEMNIDEYKTIHAKTMPSNAYKGLVWTSSDPSVATVDTHGGIKAIKSGQTDITVKSIVDSSVSCSFRVNVIAELEYIEIVGEEIPLFTYDYDKPEYQYTIKTYPEKCSYNGTPVWSSSNEKVCTVDNHGKITPVNPGETVLSVEVDGMKAAYNVLLDNQLVGAISSKLNLDKSVTFSWEGVPGTDHYEIRTKDGKTVLGSIKDDGCESYSFTDRSCIGKDIYSMEYRFYQYSVFVHSDGRRELRDIYFPIFEWYGYPESNDKVFVYFYENYDGIAIDDADFKGIIELYPNSKDVFPSDGDMLISKGSKYEFTGWNTKPDGSGKMFYAGDLMLDKISGATEENEDGISSLKLYAQWAERKVGDIRANYQDGSRVNTGSKLRLICDTKGAQIYYTTDGTTPSEINGVLYTDAIELNARDDRDVIITAVAVKDGYSDSDVKSWNLFVVGSANIWGDIPEYISNAYHPIFESADQVPHSMWTYGIADTEYDCYQIYNGKAWKAVNLDVFYHKTKLVEGKDYSVKYENNINAGTARLVVTGKGNYVGKNCVKEFSIKQYSINYLSVNDYTVAYNEKKQTIMPVVKCNLDGKLVTLKAGTDYTVEFPIAGNYDFTKPGTYTAIITGKNNYTGTTNYDINITKSALMSKATVSKIKDQNYTGDDITIASMTEAGTIGTAFSVKSGSNALIEDTIDKEGVSIENQHDGHYKITYTDNKDVGTASIILTGTGKQINNVSVVGTKVVTFKIKGTPISKALVGGYIPKEVTYNGLPWVLTNPVFSDVHLYMKGAKNTSDIPLVPYDIFTEKGDYVVEYEKNTDAGTAKIIFRGKNGYTGALTKTFKINPYNIAADTEDKFSVSLENSDFNYTKGGCKPNPTVSFELFGNGYRVNLIQGKDYSVSYENNTAVNNGANPKKQPCVKITGKGNFTGVNTEGIFTISNKSLRDDGIKITANDLVFKNAPGNYKATVTLYDVNGQKLSAGTDYDKNIVYRYANRTVVDVKNEWGPQTRSASQIVGANDIIPANTVINAYVVGKNNYIGTAVTSFRIVDCDISKATVTVDNQTFNGSEVELSKNDITVYVKVGSTNIKLNSEDYEITDYTNNKAVGKASVTIHGVGSYGGYKTVNFNIIP